MVTTKLNLSKKKRQDTQESEILIRVSIDRQHVFRVKSNLYVDEKAWNSSKQKVIITRMKTVENARLAQLQAKVDEVVHALTDRCIATPSNFINKVWLQEIVDSVVGTQVTVDKTAHGIPETVKSNEDLITTLRDFISMKCTPERAVHFTSMGNMLKRFAIYRGVNFKLEFDCITSDDLELFSKFLETEHTFFDTNGKCIKHKDVYKKVPVSRIPKARGKNAIICTMKMLRTLFNWARKTKRTTNYPFDSYKIGESVYGTPFFITSEERDALYAFDFSDRPALGRQRDIFVFQSNIGIRGGDLFELTRANVINDGIEYVANKTSDKTGNTIRVPLTAQAKEILDRYKDYEGPELLPFISMQKYNKSIKEMLKIAGINRTVTILNPTTRSEEQHPLWEVASSHMARRNFIGNLYNKTQDPNAIGSMTGHVEGSKAFHRYRAVDESIKRSLIDQL